MTTQRPLRIVTDAPDAIVERLLAQGHTVEHYTADPIELETTDLVIAANAWHLPANAPNPDAYVDAAVLWMQRRKYTAKPAKPKEAPRGKRKA